MAGSIYTSLYGGGNGGITNFANIGITNANIANAAIAAGTATNFNLTNANIAAGTATNFNITNANVAGGTAANFNITNANIAAGGAANFNLSNANLVAGSAANFSITNAQLTNAQLTGRLTFSDTGNIAANATTGTMVGTNNSQKLGLWGATPIFQPAGVGELIGTGGNAANTILATNMNSNGNTGNAAYTMNDIVKALKLAGIMKS